MKSITSGFSFCLYSFMSDNIIQTLNFSMCEIIRSQVPLLVSEPLLPVVTKNRVIDVCISLVSILPLTRLDGPFDSPFLG
jgi:hypothetical protein